MGKDGDNMEEVEKNKRLLLLIDKLINEKETEFIELIETMVEKDTVAMKKSFSIMIPKK